MSLINHFSTKRRIHSLNKPMKYSIVNLNFPLNLSLSTFLRLVRISENVIKPILSIKYSWDVYLNYFEEYSLY